MLADGGKAADDEPLATVAEITELAMDDDSISFRGSRRGHSLAA